MSLEAAVAEEIARSEAEEAAGRTRVERAGDAAAAPPPSEHEAAAVIKAIEALPAEVATPILVAGLDLAMKRLAGKKYALDADEQALLVKVWTPAVAYYLPNLSVHPLVIPAITTGVVYGLKTLPPGALANLLGGGSQGAGGAAEATNEGPGGPSPAGSAPAAEGPPVPVPPQGVVPS